MAFARLQKCIEHYWYTAPGPLWLLYPLELLYRLVSAGKRRRDTSERQALPVPVLVVGNISVGGTGKTPTLISLLNFLKARGLQPGVVSRGYGRVRNKLNTLCLVEESSRCRDVGEEPLLIFQLTGSPVCVCDDRQKAAHHLLEQHPECNVILADDGLQHYRLARDFELLLVDGERLLGNGHLLPLGPLREAAQRLQSVDWIVINQRIATEASDKLNIEELIGKPPGEMKSRLSYAQLEITSVRHLRDQHELSPAEFRTALAGNILFALAAIGHPQAFFRTAQTLSEACETHTYADHYFWQAHELQRFSGRYLLCTAKDAVKINEVLRQHPELDATHWYFLQVELRLPEALLQDIYSRIQERLS